MRKGISPIIATVLLIAISLIIAAIIFASGKKMVASFSPPVDCEQGVKYEILTKLDGGHEFQVSNPTSHDISAIKLISKNTLTDSETSTTIELAVPQGQSAKKLVTLDIANSFTAKPIINLKGKDEECSDSSLAKVELTSETPQVQVDTTPPLILSYSPIQGSNTPTNPLIITGTFNEDVSMAGISLNKMPTDITKTDGLCSITKFTSFTCSINTQTIPKGANYNTYILYTDLSGNTNTKLINYRKS